MKLEQKAVNADIVTHGPRHDHVPPQMAKETVRNLIADYLTQQGKLTEARALEEAAKAGKSTCIAELARAFHGREIDGLMMYSVLTESLSVIQTEQREKVKKGLIQAVRMALRRCGDGNTKITLDDEHKCVTRGTITRKGAGAGRPTKDVSGLTQSEISAGVAATDDTPESHAERIATALDALLTKYIGSEKVVIGDAVIAVLKKHGCLL